MHRIDMAERFRMGRGAISGQDGTITAGIDVGSTTTQAVILAGDILSYGNIITGGNSRETGLAGLEAALTGTGLAVEDIGYIVSTGYGRNMVPFADRTMSEVSCHARGAHRLYPDTRMIVDAGGEDFKVMHCNEEGRVVYFAVSDKCAAGCGRYLEIMADLLAVPLEEFGSLAGRIERQAPVLSSSCVLFAKSEALALLRDGFGRNELIAAFCNSVASILANQAKRIGIREKIMFTGGLAKNIAVARELERLLDAEVAISTEPQITGALGAAIFARHILEKRQAAQRP